MFYLIFVKNLHTHTTLHYLYNLRVSVYATSVIVDLPTVFFVCVGSDKS